MQRKSESALLRAAARNRAQRLAPDEMEICQEALRDHHVTLERLEVERVEGSLDQLSELERLRIMALRKDVDKLDPARGASESLSQLLDQSSRSQVVPIQETESSSDKTSEGATNSPSPSTRVREFVNSKRGVDVGTLICSRVAVRETAAPVEKKQQAQFIEAGTRDIMAALKKYSLAAGDRGKRFQADLVPILATLYNDAYNAGYQEGLEGTRSESPRLAIDEGILRKLLENQEAILKKVDQRHVISDSATGAPHLESIVKRAMDQQSTCLVNGIQAIEQAIQKLTIENSESIAVIQASLSDIKRFVGSFDSHLAAMREKTVSQYESAYKPPVIVGPTVAAAAEQTAGLVPATELATKTKLMGRLAALRALMNVSEIEVFEMVPGYMEAFQSGDLDLATRLVDEYSERFKPRPDR